MVPISIVTPVHDRPQTWPIIEHWMLRAINEYRGEVQWIVADDGDIPARCTLGQQHLWIKKPWPGPVKSFLGNIMRGLEAVRHETVVFIEDDDWHSSDYLTRVVSLFRDPETDVVAEGNAKYYFLPTRKYCVHPNLQHGSLCQMAIRGEKVIQAVIDLASGLPFFNLDQYIFEIVARHPYVKPHSDWTVGMKGLTPGTYIGAGHDGSWYRDQDFDGEVLKSWIGKDDADFYFDLMCRWVTMPIEESNPGVGVEK